MSVGMSIPNIWKTRKCLKPPTSYGKSQFLMGKSAKSITSVFMGKSTISMGHFQ